MSFKKLCAIVVLACMLYLLSTGQHKHKTYHFSEKPAWADEFDYTGLPDTTKWGYDIGGDGWGNNELQFYRDSGNARVNGKELMITAKPEMWQGNSFTSARLVSKGKGDFLYGRFEARVKLPVGLGTWSAIWMLPTDWAYGSWPVSGEIDIMEQVGYAQDTVHISVHTKAFNHVIGTHKTAFTFVPGATAAFHTYRVDWTPDYIQGFIDNRQIFQFERMSAEFDSWPFDKRFHWLLNLAVGGNWGGKKGVNTQDFPATLLIDYVRVYALIKP